MSAPRKFLIVADGSEESRLAAYFAARRARNTKGAVTILAVAEPAGFDHWLGVGETMRAEAREKAEADLESLVEDVEAVTETRPEVILREGERVASLRALIESDPDIAILVIAAASEGDGPGPLVGALARSGALFGARAIPVTVVPCGLTKAQLKALA